MERNLTLVFDSEATIYCVFASLIVKTESLNKMYPGGTRAFAERYSATRYNQKLAAICEMGSGYLGTYLDDLCDRGFLFKEDFYVLDSSFYPPERHVEDMLPSRNVEMEVDWLRPSSSEDEA